MKTTEYIEPLSILEMANTNGGLLGTRIAILGVAAAIAGIAYEFGKDCAVRDNEKK